jgi:S-adenosylmethionine hydrolase
MDNPITKMIGLITDFGFRGFHYVSCMKAIILKINPSAKIVDISHSITPYSIIEGQFILNSVYQYFPKGTIFIVVIDPGVGTSRDIILIRTGSGYDFIGPNNGVFSSILSSDTLVDCFKVENEEFFYKPVSNTFHGRDIMAPVAAYLSLGNNVGVFGPPFSPSKLILIPSKPVIENINKIRCNVQYIDSFGNGITTISEFKLNYGMPLTLYYNNQIFACTFTTHFGTENKGNLLLIKGSSGFLEICVNQGNASKMIGFKVGYEILVTF